MRYVYICRPNRGMQTWACTEESGSPGRRGLRRHVGGRYTYNDKNPNRRTRTRTSAALPGGGAVAGPAAHRRWSSTRAPSPLGGGPARPRGATRSPACGRCAGCAWRWTRACRRRAPPSTWRRACCCCRRAAAPRPPCPPHTTSPSPLARRTPPSRTTTDLSPHSSRCRLVSHSAVDMTVHSTL